ncbi:hypothetical protein KCU67_g13979, partial [Aureobasidium melanogenum]
KEAAAARSLQEIQAEQEFQEWWDKEAARMKEDEEFARLIAEGKTPEQAGANGKKKGNRRGGGGGKQSGHQHEKKKDGNAAGQVTPQGQGQPSRPRGGRNRGGGRGAASGVVAGHAPAPAPTAGGKA